MFELTKEQKDIIRCLSDSPKMIQTLGGYAGVGKTTIIKHLKLKLKNYRVCAYTGKAVDVLKRKGIDASTIHSLIYEPIKRGGEVHFDLKSKLDCGGIIVDEASMVGKEIYDDLISFKLPIIFVGDHGQLPPVASNGFNLMKDPEYKLEKIHRNAGPIACFAEHIRKGNNPVDFRDGNNQVIILDRLENYILLQSDQVICAYNSTRVNTNKRIRKLLNMEGLLNKGEKVMCLRNSKMEGIFNGMQGIVAKYEKDSGSNKSYINFDSFGITFYNLWIDTKSFNQEKPEFNFERGSPHPFEYAYCVTCHKAQGAEWDNVCVIEQKCDKWDHIKWAYTAASRAKNKLFWISANKKSFTIDMKDSNLKGIFF